MKKINKIASGRFSRNAKMLKLALSGGKSFLFKGDKELKEKLQDLLTSQSHKLVNELGLMKGSVMKAGQMLSLYAETVLPPELQNILSKLENQSFYLSWEEISKNLDPLLLEKLHIEPEPLAAASLGQVHRAKIVESGEEIVVKIQYKGVRKAIDSDIKTLKLLLRLSGLLPSAKDFSFVFEEVKEMLLQETDYVHEAGCAARFGDHLENDPRFRAPKVYPEFSSETVLAQEFMRGQSLREANKEGNLSQDERDELGKSFFELFLLEALEWGFVQTDPNLGNYLIGRNDQGPLWILLDFGASKELDASLKSMYRDLLFAVFRDNFEGFVEALVKYGYLRENSFNKELLKEYYDVISSPFKGAVYDWGASSIAQDAMKKAPRMIKEVSINRPPKDIVFVDRKIGGIFFVLKTLGSRFDPLEIVEKFE